MSLAPSALQQLDSACDLFSNAAVGFRAGKVLVGRLCLIGWHLSTDPCHFCLRKYIGEVNRPDASSASYNQHLFTRLFIYRSKEKAIIEEKGEHVVSDVGLVVLLLLVGTLILILSCT